MYVQGAVLCCDLISELALNTASDTQASSGVFTWHSFGPRKGRYMNLPIKRSGDFFQNFTLSLLRRTPEP